MVRPTIVIIPASFYQLDLIRAARYRGYYVVTADNRIQNPGHKEADESHCIDVKDVEGVFALAVNCKAAGIVTACSDVSLLAVAQVASRLGLHGPPWEAVKVLTNK